MHIKMTQSTYDFLLPWARGRRLAIEHGRVPDKKAALESLEDGLTKWSSRLSPKEKATLREEALREWRMRGSDEG